jgi:hypothetical protein
MWGWDAPYAPHPGSQPKRCFAHALQSASRKVVRRLPLTSLFAGRTHETFRSQPQLLIAFINLTHMCFAGL